MIAAPAAHSTGSSTWAGAITTAVNNLVTPPAATTFTTTTPAGSGWYRLTAGGMVEVHFESTGNVSATSAVTLDFTVPVGFRPSGRTPIVATSGTSPRSASSTIDSAGVWIIYNGQGSATTVCAHGIFTAA